MRRTYAQAAASYYASLAESCANRWEDEMEPEFHCAACGGPIPEDDYTSAARCAECLADEDPYVETLSLPDPDATTEERKALLLKARKLSEALKLTKDEKHTAWETYCSTATEHNVDCAALTGLVKWLETRCAQKGVAS